MKSLAEKVFVALKNANLVSYSETLKDVKEKGMVFTTAYTNQQIIDALSDIENLSLLGERFGGYANGIVFTIKPSFY